MVVRFSLTMSIPYYQVDAFASRLFTGNPAGVCVLAGWLPDSVLQAIALENNQAETAFVVQRDESFELRWFTPGLEIDLCGHATLAAAHVLFNHLGYGKESVRFQTRRAGMLTVAKEADLLVLDFPSRPPVACEVPPLLEQALGAKPVSTGKARDYLSVFRNEQEILELKPDMGLLRQLDCLGVIATAPGKDCDFVSRFFAPAAGVPEDPVTGSAHCTLIPYWAGKLGRTKLHAKQLSARGGELFCELRGERVGIGGRAVTYSTGHLHAL